MAKQLPFTPTDTVSRSLDILLKRQRRQ